MRVRANPNPNPNQVDYDHQGIQATTIVREELGALPAIRPLLLVLKTYLGKLGL